MAKQVVWSPRALSDRKNILDYWRNRNKSFVYSQKLDSIFRETVKLIREYPKIGKPTDDKQVRIKVVRDYLLIYEEAESSIHILSIWDSRQDPEKLKGIVK